MVKRIVMKKENKKKKEKNGRERDDDAASLQIVGDWMEYLNEFDLEDEVEDEDEDAQMKKRSHPAHTQRVEDEWYFVLILWIVWLEVRGEKDKDRKTVSIKKIYFYCIDSLLW